MTAPRPGIGRRQVLSRIAALLALAPLAGPSLARPGDRLVSAIEGWRRVGMRVDAGNAFNAHPFTIWAPFRDELGGSSHALIGFLDRAGRFVSERVLR